jgi:hypothetical protein
MKYAYIIGSNAFVVPSPVINYLDNGEEKEFLRINSIYHDLPPKAEQTALNVSLNVKDHNGSTITVTNNNAAPNSTFRVETERDSVKLVSRDGSTIVHIHQLDDDSAMALEHNITAELEVNTPVAVIRIFGDFLLGGLHISAENEKLFINRDGYANSVLAGKNQLKFAAEGVVL